MKRSGFFACGFALMAVAPLAAQDKPFNMVGSWSLRGQGVGMGESAFPENSNKGEVPSIYRVKLRLVVEKQDGNSFWGKALGERDSGDRFLGMLAKDGKWGMAVTAHGGQQQFWVLDATTIESCFTRSDGLRMSASCTVWTPTGVDPAPTQSKPPNMLGTWALKGDGVAKGPSMYPEHASSKEEPSVYNVAIRYVVESQVGSNFWGSSVASNGVSRPFLGALTSDGKRGVTVTSAGVQALAFVDANTIDSCFGGHAPSRVAVGCTNWIRQR